MRLIIGNRAYSSWSLRPWLALKHFGFSFADEVVPLYQPGSKERLLQLSPSGKVPCLIDGDISVWETLAILEYLADIAPEKAIWPRERAARAMARSVSSEMHAGFVALRTACTMNVRRHFTYRDFGDGARADVARIEALWRDCREQFGAGGPYLFGAFSAADAMFAPVVTRLDSYNWPMAADTRAYVETMLAHPAMQEWRTLAEAEPWVLEKFELEPLT